MMTVSPGNNNGNLDPTTTRGTSTSSNGASGDGTPGATGAIRAAATIRIMREMILNNIQQFGVTAEREAMLEFIRIALGEMF